MASLSHVPLMELSLPYFENIAWFKVHDIEKPSYKCVTEAICLKEKAHFYQDAFTKPVWKWETAVFG